MTIKVPTPCNPTNAKYANDATEAPCDSDACTRLLATAYCGPNEYFAMFPSERANYFWVCSALGQCEEREFATLSRRLPNLISDFPDGWFCGSSVISSFTYSRAKPDHRPGCLLYNLARDLGRAPNYKVYLGPHYCGYKIACSSYSVSRAHCCVAEWKLALALRIHVPRCSRRRECSRPGQRSGVWY